MKWRIPFYTTVLRVDNTNKNAEDRYGGREPSYQFLDYLKIVPKIPNFWKTCYYLVKLFQAIFGFDTGLFNVIVNSIKDRTLGNK